MIVVRTGFERMNKGIVYLYEDCMLLCCGSSTSEESNIYLTSMYLHLPV